ncbi:PdaC/SigV domain-containing protein [Maribacter sp. 2210JD10-5]|uniref:DUF3298 and DUF4163 domain-containing protein n=1 Tax=Maribacter sp. 2210JD10-5 TaxID=3386272 RepID=UPI0039BCB383
MKKSISFALLCLLFFCCDSSNEIKFETTSFHETACDACASISIDIPRAMGKSKIHTAINTALSEEIIYILNFDEETEASDIQTAIASFIEGYQELKSKYTEEATPWEAKIEGAISYEDETILTLRLESYLFTGGAHGYSTVRFLNFDKKKGIEIDNEKLFVNTDDFQKLAENKFRLQEKIPDGAPINSTGFMFETDTFYLPNNMGYTPEGLQLFYEPYEISSYADGAIILNMTFEEIQPLLAFKPKS